MRIRVMVVAMVVAVMAGCASNPPGVDPHKAAQLNADLGAHYMVQGRYQLAMKKLQTALKYNSDSASANFYMGELYSRLGQPQDADHYFREAIDLTPDDSYLQNSYGVFLCQQKHYNEGAMHMLKALDNPVYPDRGQVYDNLGHCMRDAGNPAAAEKYYREALKVDPQFSGPLLEMTRLSFEGKHYLSARAFLQRYRAVAPDTPESLWLGIRIERILGDQNALASYEMALKNNFPNSKQTQMYLKSIKQ